MANVTVVVSGGPTITVPWTEGMSAQKALEGAYVVLRSSAQFTYALQYYGTALGYLVVMINETYDSFISSAAPFFYWEFLLNGTPSPTGIDQAILEAGGVVTFEFQQYIPAKHAKSTLKAKYDLQAKR